MGRDAGRREPRKRYACRASLSGEPVSAGRETWRSKSGETLTPVPLPFDPEAIEPGDRSVWRYRAMFPLDLAPICLGEGGTPMIEASLVGLPVHFKVDYQQPSGSYKDRGSALVAAALVDTPARAAVIDSSGNAGASMAAYLARTNLPLKLFAPRDTPESMLRQAAAHGAEIDRITDGEGMISQVDGEGVVGEQPIIEPGRSHDYVSGCPLTTPHGSMQGHYTFRKSDGSLMDVAIPFFSLAAPATAG